MRRYWYRAMAMMACLVVAGCGAVDVSDSPGVASTTTLAPTTTAVAASTTVASSVDGRFTGRLAIPIGTRAEYEAHVVMTIEQSMTGAQGWSPEPGVDDIDMIADMEFDMVVNVGYDVGVTDGTWLVTADRTITALAMDVLLNDETHSGSGTFDENGVFTGTVTENGETREQIGATPDAGAEFGDLGRTVQMLISDTGEILEMTIDGEPVPKYGGSLTPAATDDALLQLSTVGPELPGRSLAPGDTWVIESEWPTGTLERTEHAVVATETIDGRTALVIEGSVWTDAYTADTVDILLLALASEVSPDAMPTRAQIEAHVAAQGMEMMVASPEVTKTSTAWIDTATGLLLAVEGTSPAEMQMRMSGTPEAPNEMVIDVRMVVTQSMHLLSLDHQG